MTTRELMSLLTGEVLDEGGELTLAELCQVCRVPAEQVFELVEHGVVEPVGRNPTRWRFHRVSIRRVRRAVRMERDLGLNLAGAALALDLLDELEDLRARLHRLDD